MKVYDSIISNFLTRLIDFDASMYNPDSMVAHFKRITRYTINVGTNLF